ncbi:hypothetical protein GW17_00014918 [Ensete ventricosum]|nr:hypothetical protein GW17_00014918 [Ensete ventricosum]
MHLVSIHARRRTNSAGRFVQESRSWGKQPASQIRGPESRGPKTDRDPERWTQGMERREQRDREYRRYRVELRLRRRRNKKYLNAAGGIYKGRERFRFLKIKRIMRPLHPPPSSGWYPSGRPHTAIHTCIDHPNPYPHRCHRQLERSGKRLTESTLVMVRVSSRVEVMRVKGSLGAQPPAFRSLAPSPPRDATDVGTPSTLTPHPTCIVGPAADEAARKRLNRMNEKLKELETQMEALEAEMSKANDFSGWS